MKKGSILAFALVAAALSQTAGAITATKEYVDRKIGETAPDYATVSNRAMSALQSHQDISGKADKADTYTKAQTDARITELSPRTSLEPATNYTDQVARRICTNDTLRSFVKDDGTVYHWITNGVWSTVNKQGDTWEDSYLEGARLYLYVAAGQTNWTWYVRGGATSPYRTIRASPDAEVLQFNYPGSKTNQFVRGRVLLYAENVGSMVSSRFDASATPGGVTNIVTDTVTKAYVEGLGIEAGISAETATNIAESVVNATVTGVVRSVSFKVKDYIFDPVTEICWRRQMVNGFLDYIAVTNIDVTLPENYEALEALERRDNQ